MKSAAALAASGCNSGNGCGRTSSRLTYLAGLHVVSLACAGRHLNAATTRLRSLRLAWRCSARWPPFPFSSGSRPTPRALPSPDQSWPPALRAVCGPGRHAPSTSLPAYLIGGRRSRQGERRPGQYGRRSRVPGGAEGQPAAHEAVAGFTTPPAVAGRRPGTAGTRGRRAHPAVGPMRLPGHAAAEPSTR